jgi:hypothetical protein
MHRFQADWPALKRKPFSLAAGADPQEVVAAVAGKVIRVIFCDYEVAEAATAVLYSGAATAIGPEVGRSRIWPPCYAGWCETAKGEALNLKATGGAVKGLVGYIEA